MKRHDESRMSVRPISASHSSPRKSKARWEEPKYYGAVAMEEKLDMSSCDFQKHGNKMPSFGGETAKALSDKSNGCCCWIKMHWLTKQPGNASLPRFLFHHCAALYGSFFQPPSSLSLPTTPSSPTPPPPHYHTPLKSIARIKLLFISALWQSRDWGIYAFLRVIPAVILW